MKKALVTLLMLSIALGINPPFANAKADCSSTLSDQAVTFDDLNSENSDGLRLLSINNEKVYRQDRTEELEKHCLFDCSKVVWFVPVRAYQPDGYRRLTVTLLQASSEEQASQVLNNLYKYFHHPMDREFYDYSKEMRWSSLGFSNDSWAVYDQTYTLGTRKGLVVFLASMKMRGFFEIDGPGEISFLASYARLQFKKLEMATCG